jgi:hypothetical protein
MNANGDVLRWDGTAQVLGCGSCRSYLRETGLRVAYTSPELVDWSGECDWCRQRRLAREAEEEERRRREEERLRPVTCELEGCDATFVKQTKWQLYCTPEHRWKAFREAKKAGQRLRLVSDDRRAAGGL